MKDTCLLPRMSFAGVMGSVAHPVPAGPLQKKAHTQLCKPWCLHYPRQRLWWHLWDFSPIVVKLPDRLWGQLQLMGESGQVLPWGLWVLEWDCAVQWVYSFLDPLASRWLGPGARPGHCAGWLAPSCE